MATLAYGSRYDRAYSFAISPPAIWLGMEIAKRRARAQLSSWMTFALVMTRYASLRLLGTVPASDTGSTATLPRILPKFNRRSMMDMLVLVPIIVACIAPALSIPFSSPAASHQDAQLTVAAEAGSPVAAAAEASTPPKAVPAPTEAVPAPPPPPPPPVVSEQELWARTAEAVSARGGDWVNQGLALAYLIRSGFTPVQGSGIVGGFMVESPGVNPATPQYGGGPGFGIAQWEGGRKTQLFNSAAANGRPVEDLMFQLEFSVWEFNTTETHARDKIRTATDATTAAVLARKYYERPSVYHDDRRIAHANALISAFMEELPGVRAAYAQADPATSG